jgi:hypothetical protein
MNNAEKEPELDANAILDRLITARELKSGWGRDSDLGRALDISPKLIWTWRERNTLDHQLIAHKSRAWNLSLSLSWVFFGDGPQEILPPPAPSTPLDALRMLYRQCEKWLKYFDATEMDSMAEADAGDGSTEDDSQSSPIHLSPDLIAQSSQHA